MGQQASRCLWVNPDYLTACALGVGRSGQENELVTNFDNTRAYSDSAIYENHGNVKTPQGVFTAKHSDAPGAAAKLERTVRRRLFEEDPVLNLRTLQEKSPLSPVWPCGSRVATSCEGLRP